MQINKREEIKKKIPQIFFLRRMLRQMQEESQNGVSSCLFFLKLISMITLYMGFLSLYKNTLNNWDYSQCLRYCTIWTDSAGASKEQERWHPSFSFPWHLRFSETNLPLASTAGPRRWWLSHSLHDFYPYQLLFSPAHWNILYACLEQAGITAEKTKPWYLLPFLSKVGAALYSDLKIQKLC